MYSSQDATPGIESLSESIPNYADKFIAMSKDTEEMAKELEDRMRYLEDGYDYLSKVSAQVPEAIREMSSNYKLQTLDGANMGVLDEKEKENLAEQSNNLDHLKKELHSISQERVIVEVFTRATITRAKAASTKLGVDSEPAFINAQKSQKASYTKRGHALARSGYPDKGVKGDLTAKSSLLATEAPAQYPNGMNSDGNAYIDPNSPIDIPSFRTTHDSHGRSIQHTRNSSSSDVYDDSDGGASSRKTKPSVRVRPTVGNVMVPSMRQGSLPEEIRHIQTRPTMDIQVHMTKVMENKEKKTQQKAVTSVQRLVAPVAKALRNELRQNKKDMEILRAEVNDTRRQAHTENVAQRRVIRSLAGTFETRMTEQQEALKTEMQTVVSDAFDRLNATLQQLQSNRNEDEQEEDSDDDGDDNDSSGSERDAHSRSPSLRKANDRSTRSNNSKPGRTRGNKTQRKRKNVSAVKVRYDMDGHRIVERRRKHTASERSTRYDINGRRIRSHEEDEETTDGIEASGNVARSPRGVWSPTSSHRTSPLSSPTSRSAAVARVQGEACEAEDQQPVVDEEYFYDPQTGNRYRLLKPSSYSSSSSPSPMLHSPEGVSPKNAFSGTAGPGSVASGVSASTMGRSRAYYSNMKVGQPLPSPPQTEAEKEREQQLLTEFETGARRAQEIGGMQQLTRSEYTLVSGPHGVQWKATQVPVNPYIHPDVSHRCLVSGGEGTVGLVDAILPKDMGQDIQNPLKAGLDAASHALDLHNPHGNIDSMRSSEGREDESSAVGAADLAFREDSHGRGVRLGTIDEKAKQHAMTAMLGVVGGKSDIVTIEGEAGGAHSAAAGGGHYKGPRANALDVLPELEQEELNEEEREHLWSKRSEAMLAGPSFPTVPPHEEGGHIPLPELNEPLIVQSKSRNPNTAATVSQTKVSGAPEERGSGAEGPKTTASKHAHVYDFQSKIRVERTSSTEVEVAQTPYESREKDEKEEKEGDVGDAQEVVDDEDTQLHFSRDEEEEETGHEPEHVFEQMHGEASEELLPPGNTTKHEQESEPAPVPALEQTIEPEAPLEQVSLNSSLGKKLQQVVPALQPVSTPASAPEPVPTSAPASAATSAGVNAQPTATEFAVALVDALKAAASTVAPPAPAPAPAPVPVPAPAPAPRDVEALMREGVQQGIEAGVREALEGLKRRQKLKKQREIDAKERQSAPTLTEEVRARHERAANTAVFENNEYETKRGSGDEFVKKPHKKPHHHSRLLEAYRAARPAAVGLRPRAAISATVFEGSAQKAHISARGRRGEFMPLISGMLGSKATAAAADLSWSLGSDSLSEDNGEMPSGAILPDHIPPAESPETRRNSYHPEALARHVEDSTARYAGVTSNGTAEAAVALAGVKLAPSVVAKLAQDDSNREKEGRGANSTFDLEGSGSEDWISIGDPADDADDVSRISVSIDIDSSNYAHTTSSMHPPQPQSEEREDVDLEVEVLDEG